MLKHGFFIVLLMMSTSFQSIEPKLTLVLDAKAVLGEGAIWNPVEQKLYWVDIEGKTLHIYDPSTGKDLKLPMPDRIGTVVPLDASLVLVALQNGIHKIDVKTGSLTFIVNPLPDSQLRFNDGKCDPSGRFWVGSLALDERKKGASLYRMDSDHSIHVMLTDVSISNGIVWTSDKKTMYYNDTPTLTIQAFDYNDLTGEISNRRVAVKIPKDSGAPDGMTIDSDDKLWVALWGGSCVAQFDPVSGDLLQKISVPAPNVSSCAFGGEGLQTLFITTAREGLSPEKLEEFPMSGGVFSVKPGASGVLANFFLEQ